MPKKRLTLEELRERREDTDQGILQVRKILETHQAERERLYSVENRRRLSPQGLAEDEAKLRRTTEAKLATANARIAQSVREAVEHRDTWRYDHELRTARFAPETTGTPGTEAAQQRAIYNEILEALKRGNVENRAHRYSPEDLIIETERAALAGDTASLSVFQQEARNRKLAGLEKLSFDTAFKKLTLPEVDEAAEVFKDLEDLSQEADALFTLWKEPQNQTAQTYESLGRFNRKKRAQAFVKMIEEMKVTEAEAARIQWQQSSQGVAPEPKADTPEPPPMAA